MSNLFIHSDTSFCAVRVAYTYLLAILGILALALTFCMLGCASSNEHETALPESLSFADSADSTNDDSSNSTPLTKTMPSNGSDLAANWSPDPANVTFHPLFDTTWDDAAEATLSGGASEPFSVPGTSDGIEFVGIEDGVARFCINLDCEGGNIAETRFCTGDLPDIGVVEAKGRFQGLNSREDAWGQPTFPASTLPVYPSFLFPDYDTTAEASGDLLARVPSEATSGDEFEQAEAAALMLDGVVLTVDGSFAGGGAESRFYRITPVESIADILRSKAKAQADTTTAPDDPRLCAPLFTFQRIGNYDDLPETAFPVCWSIDQQAALEAQRATRE